MEPAKLSRANENATLFAKALVEKQLAAPFEEWAGRAIDDFGRCHARSSDVLRGVIREELDASMLVQACGDGPLSPLRLFMDFLRGYPDAPGLDLET